jgi:REP element-mobilizing transposase RayT
MISNGIYHVTARGNRRAALFHDDHDCHRFLWLLDDVVKRCGWSCHAYCLMPNHFHLVVETPKADISAGMHSLSGGYARWFNRRYDLEGHVFQRRFHSVLVDSDWHLIELFRYLAMNPVRAKICAHPGQWPWSSYRACVGETPRPPFLTLERIVGHFGHDPDRARQSFRLFVGELRSPSL